MDVLALTQVFERRMYRQFSLHVRVNGIHPGVAATLRRMVEKERAHLRWVKAWLDEQAKSRRAEVRDVIRKYSAAEERIYDTLSTEFSLLKPLRVA
jgi:rubrerythrin